MMNVEEKLMKATLTMRRLYSQFPNCAVIENEINMVKILQVQQYADLREETITASNLKLVPNRK